MLAIQQHDPIRSLEHAAQAARANRHAVSVVELLRIADHLTITALQILARDHTQPVAGLPSEIAISLDTRRLASDARAITQTAATLRHMPHLAAAADQGLISPSQLRAISHQTRSLAPSERDQIDQLISRHAPTYATADPEQLLGLIDDQIALHHDNKLAARETRAHASRFLVAQPRIDGAGGSIYLQADADQFATMLTAIDHAAAQPHNPADPHAPTRAQQRLDALAHICHQSLTGRRRGGSGRAMPRILISVDARTPQHAVAKLLWNTPSPPPRISRALLQSLACDAQIQTITHNQATPIAASSPKQLNPSRIRAALEARDHGCRFPGCQRPVAWTEIHHIIPRNQPTSSNHPSNLILLCRRCHQRIHRHHWQIRHHNNGTITFCHRGRIHHSPPPHQPRE